MKLLGLLVAVAIVVAVAWFNYGVLVEAYGSGPPYYGRTTNMDKWSSPVPWLLAIDAVAVALAAGVLWMTRRMSP